MAQGTPKDKSELFIKRAKQFNLSFIVSITVMFLVSALMHNFFSMPVAPKLLTYIYAIELGTALISYAVAFFVRKKMLPVKISEDIYWSYTAVRRYFWSYVLLCLPFGIAFLFYLFAGNLSALLLGYLLSLLGLILFRPRRGDVV
ncbi:MAG: hypothetical protein GXO18_02660 [Aquificae bacterium]|nr:hypothetical protein [Aquificota bacterium]